MKMTKYRGRGEAGRGCTHRLSPCRVYALPPSLPPLAILTPCPWSLLPSLGPSLETQDREKKFAKCRETSSAIPSIKKSATDPSSTHRNCSTLLVAYAPPEITAPPMDMRRIRGNEEWRCCAPGSGTRTRTRYHRYLAQTSAFRYKRTARAPFFAYPPCRPTSPCPL